jgi:hypothetical protein
MEAFICSVLLTISKDFLGYTLAKGRMIWPTHKGIGETTKGFDI